MNASVHTILQSLKSTLEADGPTVSQYLPYVDAAIAAEQAGIERNKSDTARLDFLDQCNIRLNTHFKTRYGWKLVMNHNVNRLMTGRHLDVDLQDAEAQGCTSCRDAIDAEIRRIDAARATIAGGQA